jgi:hypothetical protein
MENSCEQTESVEGRRKIKTNLEEVVLSCRVVLLALCVRDIDTTNIKILSSNLSFPQNNTLHIYTETNTLIT